MALSTNALCFITLLLVLGVEDLRIKTPTCPQTPPISFLLPHNCIPLQFVLNAGGP